MRWDGRREHTTRRCQRIRNCRGVKTILRLRAQPQQPDRSRGRSQTIPLGRTPGAGRLWWWVDVALHAIPTTYAGIRFRSRLEARWAVLFELLGWPWAYEPFDLLGYIPDFVLPVGWGGRTRPLLVEVKPAQYIQDLPPHARRIFDSGWEGDAILVGGCIFEQADSGHDILGVIADCSDRTITVARSFLCEECRRASFAGFHHLDIDDDGSVRVGRMGEKMPCRLCGATGTHVAGGHYVPDDDGARSLDLHGSWAKAGNIVQWHAGA